MSAPEDVTAARLPRNTPESQSPPPYKRPVFAHLLSFDCACPNCGTVHVGPTTVRGRKILATGYRKRAKSTGYDPLTGRFTCGTCQRAYTMGIIFWPVVPGDSKSKRPTDAMPTVQEAVQLREQASRLSAITRRNSRAPGNVLETEPAEIPPMKHGESDVIEE